MAIVDNILNPLKLIRIMPLAQDGPVRRERNQKEGRNQQHGQARFPSARNVSIERKGVCERLQPGNPGG